LRRLETLGASAVEYAKSLGFMFSSGKLASMINFFKQIPIKVCDSGDTMPNKLRIFVLEDSSEDVIFLKRFLIQGFGDVLLTHVTSIVEAEKYLGKSDDFDIILADLNLPDCSGLETFIKIHNLLPDVPVLVFSVETDLSIALACLEKGAQDYIVKRELSVPLLHSKINFSITRHKLNRQLENANAKLYQSARLASLGEMSGGLAHEINNPLTIILATNELLIRKLVQKRFDEGEMLANLKVIEINSTRIQKIINGMFLISNSHDGLKMQLVFIKDLIEETVNLFCREKFRKNLIPLKMEFRTDKTITCQPSQISEVILNLMNNAFDAVMKLEKKWVELEVWDDSDFLTIAVTDSGNGIPEKTVEKMMQPFFTTKDVGAGTGLGLCISKGVVESHQGIFEYDSKHPNTRFLIKLPLHAKEKTA
jgi:signal transduction histidine kinase